jgi:adenylate cyclase
VGETRLGVELSEKISDSEVDDSPGTDVTKTIDATLDQEVLFRGPDAAKNRLYPLLDLPVRLEAAESLEEILDCILSHAMKMLPAAERSAIMLLDPDENRLMLKAHAGSGIPPVHQALARRAIEERRGLIFHRGSDSGQSSSAVQSGIYAPMICKEEGLGVICVDNTRFEEAFSEDDLRLLMFISQTAALKVANKRSQTNVQQRIHHLERLVDGFSPEARKEILEAGRGDWIRRGCEKSEITVLHADIRGLSRACAGAREDDVSDLLDLYVSGLAKEVFAQKGTVNRLVGDTFVAVFGGLKSDSRHHEAAVRAAWAMVNEANLLNERRTRQSQVVCPLGIGLHCGPAFHGFVGNSERLEFAVVGEVVESARKLSGIARPGEIILSSELEKRVSAISSSERLILRDGDASDMDAYCLKNVVAAG